MLAAVPPEIPAIGVEIDPDLARQAEALSGRTVLVGDFRTLTLPVQPTAVYGNPPFQSRLIDSFLTRAHQLLPREGTVGFILPAHVLQTSRRTMQYTEQWALEVTLLPRDIFKRLHLSLVFACFRKGAPRTLIGLTLFPETAAWRDFPRPIHHLLGASSRSVWVAAVREALTQLGGTATLSALYRFLAQKRPTGNPWWEAKIRQTLRHYPDLFERLKPGLYTIRQRTLGPITTQPGLYA